MSYASGAGIAKFPSSGVLVAASLQDQGQEVITGESMAAGRVPVLGLLPDVGQKASGRLAVYGDSNCLDSSHMQKDCFWLMDALLDFSIYGNIPLAWLDKDSSTLARNLELPERMEGTVCRAE